MTTHDRSEVVVFGGGPAGTAAALGLARVGARVTLIERASERVFKPGEIIEAIVKYPLRELGVWEQFQKLGSLMIAGRVSIWGEDEPIEADGMLNPHGTGFLVSRARMEKWLIDEVVAAGVVVLRGRRRVELDLSRRAVSWCGDGRRHTAHPAIVIEATGRGAGVVRRMGRRRFDRLIGLLAYLPNQLGPCDQRLIIEGARDGWWYSAPLPDKCRVVAFMTDWDLLPAVHQHTAFFSDRLEETRLIRSRYKEEMSVTKLRSYPAATTQHQNVSGPGWVAIGDAASTYDPLSGCGVARALSRGVAIARLLAQSATMEKALAVYADAERAAFDDYLAAHRRVYAREHRWCDAAFWRRRAQ